MKEGHIYLYGEFYPDQSKYASDWGLVSVKDVMTQIKNNQDAEKLIVHIHSPGGDVIEGFAIYDVLKSSGKVIDTLIEGMCASIATIPFLAGENRVITENSEFLIHNPWGFAMGDAADMEDYADMLKKFEDKIVNHYVQLTGSDEQALRDLMVEDKFISSQEAVDLGFATEVLETIKAVASFNNKQNKTMDKTIEGKILAELGKIKNLFGKKKKEEIPTNLERTTADGLKITFDSEDNEIHVGNTVVVDNDKPEDGEYMLDDKTKLAVKDGKVESITPPVDVVVDPQKPEPKKEGDETLKNEVTELNEAIKSQDTVITKMLETMNTLAENITSSFVPEADRTFIKNRREAEETNPAAAALKRRKDAASE